MKRIRLYWNTIRYLKIKQIFYLLIYRIRIRRQSPGTFKSSSEKEITETPLKFEFQLFSPTSYRDGSFEFLNKSHDFGSSIDWDFSEHGMLWAYNLNYFDFINQEDINIDDCIYLINDYIEKLPSLKPGMDPYPVSLRTRNWIKFFIRNKEKLLIHKSFDFDLFKAALRYQLICLSRNLEYHLMGNHLLENGFALLFGAYFFNDRRLYRKAKRILDQELNEQILSDGGHFEQSPMYHQIILSRLLDAYNLVSRNDSFKKELLPEILQKAQSMLSWLENISFRSGQIPLFNDSATGIAPTTLQLLSYARQLGVGSDPGDIRLGESGYRKFANHVYEIVLDIGEISAGYQPGHSHSDTFNFELYHQGSPLIVDTGTSTYERNELRSMQRSTRAHNTVCLEDYDSNEVWSSFRMGRRASVNVLVDSDTVAEATHDGYKPLGITHHRSFKFSRDQIEIYDRLTGRDVSRGIFNLHFHPDVLINCEDNSLKGNGFEIDFTLPQKLSVLDFDYADLFNKTTPSQYVSIQFTGSLETIIKFTSR